MPRMSYADRNSVARNDLNFMRTLTIERVQQLTGCEGPNERLPLVNTSLLLRQLLSHCDNS